MSDETKTFEELIVIGRGLLRIEEYYPIEDPLSAHKEFQEWDEEVVKWLGEEFPMSGQSAKWSLLEGSNLTSKGPFDIINSTRWDVFFTRVKERIKFLSTVVKNNPTSKPTKNTSPAKTKAGSSKKVFVVHGHDEKVKLEVAGLLGKLKLEPIILHDQPNKGRTIIQKFEDHSDVAFAVVLLTADDKGGKVETPEGKYSLRARQNVIMELGFFLGKLERKSVCALYENGVELPSDYYGVLFLPLDKEGAWHTGLPSV